MTTTSVPELDNGTILRILETARTGWPTPENWTQGTYARDANGEPCSVHEGVSHCAQGRLIKTIADMGLPFQEWDPKGQAYVNSRAYQDSHRKLGVALALMDGTNGVHIWNDRDGRTPEEVAQLYDDAIEITKEDMKSD